MEDLFCSLKWSNHHQSQELVPRRTSLQHMLKKIKLKPYRLIIHQKLKGLDMQRHMQMVQWFQQHPGVLYKIWFSDEAHSWLCVRGNSHSAVHWEWDRPDEVLPQAFSLKELAQCVSSHVEESEADQLLLLGWEQKCWDNHLRPLHCYCPETLLDSPRVSL